MAVMIHALVVLARNISIAVDGNMDDTFLHYCDRGCNKMVHQREKGIFLLHLVAEDAFCSDIKI